jgi:molybdenum cofactor biosynthesis protein B
MTNSHPRKPHAHKDTGPVRAAVITVSDTRTTADDTSGSLASELLRGAGHEVVAQLIVEDDRGAIVRSIRAAIAEDARLVVLTGGTGIAARDVTYEAVASIVDKALDGFGEAFRRLSWDEIGPRAVLSRAIAGVHGRALIVALPGSTKAVRLGIEQVLLPIAAHAIGLL